MIVIIESPLAAPTGEQLERHRIYALRAMKHVLAAGHTPFASHLLYPQVLDDNNPQQREQGMRAGFAITRALGLSNKQTLPHLDDDIYAECWVFTDYGLSAGMKQGISIATSAGLAVQFTEIGPNHAPDAIAINTAQKQPPDKQTP